mmetsp:Transcript_21977/g.45779  ORF Transcript_21977/g.45779 Transcript_21977/m.45779 type:complete len:579 (+) Transcript_21977:266-2002(+)
MSTTFSHQPTAGHSPHLDRHGARKPIDKSSPNSDIKKQTAALSLANLFSGGRVLTQESVDTAISVESRASLPSPPMPNNKPNNINVDILSCEHERGKENFPQPRSKRRCLETIPEGSGQEIPFHNFQPREALSHGKPRTEVYYPNYHPAYPITFSSPRKKSRLDYSAKPPENSYIENQIEEIAAIGGSFHSAVPDSTPQKVAAILASELPFSQADSQPSQGDPDAVELPPIQNHGFDPNNHGIMQLMEATRFASSIPVAPPPARNGRRRQIHPDEIASINLTEKEMISSLMTRKEKSLGVVCQNFIELFRNAPVYNGTENSGAEVDIVNVANQLDVKRRRIYDIINIMESVEIVSRLKKNTYRWHGLDNLPSFFARLQKEGYQARKMKRMYPHLKELPTDDSKTIKGMGNTCQKLIQIFLVTHKIDIGLTDAAEEVLGPLPKSEKQKDNETGGGSAPSVSGEKKDDGSDSKDESKDSGGEGKAMKTKIRRMYDIANVLQSIGIIRKENVGSTSSKNKPSFRWVYRILPRDMHKYLLPEDDYVSPMCHDNHAGGTSAPITPEECHSSIFPTGTTARRAS